MFQNDGLGFLDLLNLMSFLLQVQNSESHKIDQLRDEILKQFQNQNRVLLEDINKKLDLILSKLDK